ncbi:MAG: PAS domain S-box protein [Anaerolineales bacterium]|uniref:PAS domain S-box protein n=1 Tax=Candidatus Villigracilis proximus TaxID=3140683 RepID=UPI003134FA8E|nr:PAS domain S-box protein [Anaerolineales bacterium]
MQKLKDSELRYRRLFEAAEDGILILDAETGMIEDVNPFLINMLGYSREEFVEKKLWEVGAFKDIEASQNAFEALQISEYIRYEDLPLKTKDGYLIQVEFVSNVYLVEDEKVIQCNIRDITARKHAEDAMQGSEARYRRLFEAAEDGILILDAKTGRIGDVNPYLIKMLGYSREEFVEKKLWEVGAFKDIEASQDAFEALQEHKFIRYEDLPLRAKDGQLIQVEFVSNVYLVGDEKVIQCNIRDITEHKRIIVALQENEKRYYDLVNQSPEGVFIIEISGKILTVNKAMCRELAFNEEELLSMSIWDIIPQDYLGQYRKSLSKILEGKILEGAAEYAVCGKDGKIHYVEVLSAPHYNGKDIIDFQGIARDITARKHSEEQIRRQLEHLTALSGIDRIIAANFDLELSLSEILIHVAVELGIDAADILILNTNSQMLEYGAERGFRTKTIRNRQVYLGEGYAGRAALDRQLIRIPNLRDAPDNQFLTALLEGEDFICYFGVPLIIKGQVKGVLEVFHRDALEPDEEWFDFLNSLAGQAAIAIEIVTLFASLQRSNSELAMAYDATIEGWSRALDLRDKETEGHTQRVTEMAVKLARAFGLNEEELVQVRWGALLHDIGKMGVPDSILHKPSPLTGEEWPAMKMHPTFAYEMLSPIRYLRLALDIPYSHHEKWDGSGYPHGLKGAQIPLVARIFAVVDVWDALTSDRPYRSAWTKEKVRDHILSSSGTHFDPQVVDIFMQIPA